jgi:transcriptional regulator with XRE-family HTH domain
MLNLPNNIKLIRTLKGLTQAQVAKQLNISETAYNKLENDKTDLTTDRLQKLADIFGVDVRDIQDFNPTNFILNTKNKQQNGVVINHPDDETLVFFKTRIIALEKECESKNAQINAQQNQISVMQNQIDTLLKMLNAEK